MLRPYAFRPAKLYVRSDDCRGPGRVATPSRFRVTLPEEVQGAKGVCLLGARIPNTFASLPPYQRWVGYIMTDPSGGQHYRVFQLDGSAFLYNYGSLVTQLNLAATQWWEVLLDGVKANSHTYALSAISRVPDLQFAIDPTSRRVTIKNVSTQGTIRMMDMATMATCVVENELVKPWLYANQIIGLDVDTLSPTINRGATYECPFPADLCRTDSVYIQVNGLFLNGVQSTNGSRNILETVAVDVPPLGVISYTVNCPHWISNLPANISDLEFRLLDENGQELTDISQNANVELVLGFIYHTDE